MEEEEEGVEGHGDEALVEVVGRGGAVEGERHGADVSAEAGGEGLRGRGVVGELQVLGCLGLGYLGLGGVSDENVVAKSQSFYPLSHLDQTSDAIRNLQHRKKRLWIERQLLVVDGRNWGKVVHEFLRRRGGGGGGG